jgi:CheY-like chemotaxis protein
VRRVRLIHWKPEEAEDLVEHLHASGFEVCVEVPSGRAFLCDLADAPPDAVIIDLSRLPSQGRDMGVLIRNRKSTRHIPLVFAGGDAEKVARIKGLLPDATYTSWEEMDAVLRYVIEHPSENPVVPGSSFAAYAGRPLVDKLGIKMDAVVGLVDAPAGFEEMLGKLPDGVRFAEGVSDSSDLIIWFVRSYDDLQEGIASITVGLDRGPLWIAWPKKKSGVVTDLTQQAVRERGLAAGLVDYKVCSIDKVWSALLCTRRRTQD